MLKKSKKNYAKKNYSKRKKKINSKKKNTFSKQKFYKHRGGAERMLQDQKKIDKFKITDMNDLKDKLGLVKGTENICLLKNCELGSGKFGTTFKITSTNTSTNLNSDYVIKVPIILNHRSHKENEKIEVFMNSVLKTGSGNDGNDKKGKVYVTEYLGVFGYDNLVNIEYPMNGYNNSESNSTLKLQYFNVFEYCDLGSLDDWFPKNVSNYTESHNGLVDYISMNILKGLNYIHSLGITHNDLKCDNILVKSFKESKSKFKFIVKICDFGQATKDFDHRTEKIYLNENRLFTPSRVPFMYSINYICGVWDGTVPPGNESHNKLYPGGVKVKCNINKTDVYKIYKLTDYYCFFIIRYTMLLSFMSKNNNLTLIELINNNRPIITKSEFSDKFKNRLIEPEPEPTEKGIESNDVFRIELKSIPNENKGTFTINKTTYDLFFHHENANVLDKVEAFLTLIKDTRDEFNVFLKDYFGDIEYTSPIKAYKERNGKGTVVILVKQTDGYYKDERNIIYERTTDAYGDTIYKGNYGEILYPKE